MNEMDGELRKRVTDSLEVSREDLEFKLLLSYAPGSGSVNAFPLSLKLPVYLF